MSSSAPKSPLYFTPERFADRLAEAIRFSKDPVAFQKLPAWTQRVMLILKDQLVPDELASMLASDQTVFAEGVCIAWMAHARDIVQQRETNEAQFARKVAEHLTRMPETQHVLEQVETAEITASPEFREHIMRRLFAPNATERRAFAEGLALGNRVYELFNHQSGQRSTDATGVYLLLWLYWPEITELGSVGEAARLLESLFGPNRNLAGRHWEERFRKLANRIGLSFRAKQAVRGKIARGSRPASQSGPTSTARE